ncbi:MAG: HDIG domain-containing protein [Candidatus Omnitrophica bacterium]|nr:HDIG domain-containing protein [Candidatus Omnitrophota bacterium]
MVKFFSGVRLSLILASVFVVALMLNSVFGSFFYSGNMRSGDISLRTIYAPYDFRYPAGIDEEKTREAKNEIRSDVPLVFYIDNSREEASINTLKAFFSALPGLANLDKEKKPAAVAELKTAAGIDVPDALVLYFAVKDDKDTINLKLVDILASIYPLGIVSPEDNTATPGKVKFAKVINKRILTERLVPMNDLMTLDHAKEIAKNYAAKVFPRDTKLVNNAAELLAAAIKTNLTYSSEETDALREQAVKNLAPVYRMDEVKKNELILERGKRITAENIAQLSQLGIIGGVTHRGPYFSGMFIVVMVLVLIGYMYLAVIEKKLLTHPKEIVIVLIVSLVFIFAGQFIVQSSQPPYVIPIASVSMLLALMVTSNAAFLATMLLSLYMGVLVPGHPDIVLVFLVSGFTAVCIVRDARRRSRIMLAGIVSGIMAGLTVIGFGLINNIEPRTYVNSALWGCGGGVISIFLVMGLLPFFETVFKITTNITLLELSDLNFPLLKELTLKAPGTYQHSIMVGNLTEAACDAIGANSLLARVGAYYHDIGKIEKAEYFAENEMGLGSKHEKLTPSMSALVITNHVKDGIELARKYKLNPKIIEFIEEHHGTGLIYYFYQRALEQSEEDSALPEEEFRYQGPKPQSKESAIVLLADSVEASSRALSDPTPARIQGMVQKVINNKFIDNQLDECDLTLKDLNKISESFVRVLTAVFHTRLEYPDVKDMHKRNNGTNKHKESE